MFHYTHVRILLTTGQMDLEIVKKIFWCFNYKQLNKCFGDGKRSKFWQQSLHPCMSKLQNTSNIWNVLSQIKSLDCGPQHESLIMRAQAMLNTAVIDVAQSCWESGISDLSLRACCPNCTEYKKLRGAKNLIVTNEGGFKVFDALWCARAGPCCMLSEWRSASLWLNSNKKIMF